MFLGNTCALSTLSTFPSISAIDLRTYADATEHVRERKLCNSFYHNSSNGYNRQTVYLGCACTPYRLLLILATYIGSSTSLGLANLLHPVVLEGRAVLF